MKNIIDLTYLTESLLVSLVAKFESFHPYVLYKNLNHRESKLVQARKTLILINLNFCKGQLDIYGAWIFNNKI